MKYWFTYVLKSLKDNKNYIGCSSNICKRLQEHNSGKVKSTRNRKPLELIYFECCQNKKKALAREKYFKTNFGRAFLKKRI